MYLKQYLNQIQECETNQFLFDRFSLKVPIFLYFMEKTYPKFHDLSSKKTPKVFYSLICCTSSVHKECLIKTEFCSDITENWLFLLNINIFCPSVSAYSLWTSFHLFYYPNEIFTYNLRVTWRVIRLQPHLENPSVYNRLWQSNTALIYHKNQRATNSWVLWHNTDDAPNVDGDVFRRSLGQEHSVWVLRSPCSLCNRPKYIVNA